MITFQQTKCQGWKMRKYFSTSRKSVSYGFSCQFFSKPVLKHKKSSGPPLNENGGHKCAFLTHWQRSASEWMGRHYFYVNVTILFQHFPVIKYKKFGSEVETFSLSLSCSWTFFASSSPCLFPKTDIPLFVNIMVGQLLPNKFSSLYFLGWIRQYSSVEDLRSCKLLQNRPSFNKLTLTSSG